MEPTTKTTPEPVTTIAVELPAPVAAALQLVARHAGRPAGELAAGIILDVVAPVVTRIAAAEAAAARQRETAAHRLAILLEWWAALRDRGPMGRKQATARFLTGLRERRGLRLCERTLLYWDAAHRDGRGLGDGRVKRPGEAMADPFFALVLAERRGGRHRTVAATWRAACGAADAAGVTRKSYKQTERFLRPGGRAGEGASNAVQSGGERTVVQSVKRAAHGPADKGTAREMASFDARPAARGGPRRETANPPLLPPARR